MPQTPSKTWPWDAAAAATLLTFLATAFGATQPGIYMDEVLFTYGIWPEWGHVAYRSAPGFSGEPVMILPYLGALKAWLYRPWIDLVEANTFWLRLPPMLLGTAGLAFAYLSAKRLLGAPPALAGLLLAATDTTLYWTTRIDWGPVALQRFLLALAVYLGLRAKRQRAPLYALAAGFCCGLGVWDKLSFAWLLAAAATALALAYPFRRTWLWARRFGPAAALGALLGAAPYIAYATSTTDDPPPIQLETQAPDFRAKRFALWKAFDGHVFRGWATPAGLIPGTETAAIRAWPNRILFFAALVLLRFVRRRIPRRPLATLALFCVFSWSAMFAIDGAGMLHHLSLVLPAPQFFIAGLFTATARHHRWLTYAALALLTGVVAQNLRTATAFPQGLRGHGTTALWSEALYDLSAQLSAQGVQRVAATSWGLVTPLGYLSRGQLETHELYYGGDDAGARQYLADIAALPGKTAVISYAPGAQPVSVPELAPELALPPTLRVQDGGGRTIYQVRILQPPSR